MLHALGSDTTYFGLPPQKVYLASGITELNSVLLSADKGYVIAELCGGEGRASILSVRRRLSVGKNFDLVTNVDLNSPTDQEATFRYFADNTVLVAVMAPI